MAGVAGSGEWIYSWFGSSAFRNERAGKPINFSEYANLRKPDRYLRI
jgi:hypothetical protein